MGIPYNTIDWQNIGSPMTPFLSIQFRGSGYIHTFPNPTNRIYIESANFDVLNDAGSSTASITLVDPDFINLEAFFARALVTANRSSKINGYWFCRCFWGWTYYGKQVTFDDGGVGQGKHSGIHAFMLKDLNYDLDDVELKVTFELIDLGEGLFNGRHGEPDPQVGILDITDKPKEGGSGSDSAKNTGSPSPEEIEQEAYKEIFGQKEGDDFYKELREGSNLGQGLESSGFYVEDASSNESPNIDEVPVAENIFFNRTPWYILKTVLQKWWSKNNPNDPPLSVTWDTTIDGTRDGGPSNQDTLEKHVISAKSGIRETVETLLNVMELEGYDAVFIAGVRLIPGANGFSPTPGIVFGWQPNPPKTTMDDETASNMFRLARTFVYKPGNKEQIAKGQTMIKSLNYEWTSKGYYMMGLPKIYSITIDNAGKLHVFSTETEFEKATPDEKKNIYFMSSSDSENQGVTAKENKLNTALELLPSENPENVAPVIEGQSGAYEIEWNYESREGNEVEIEKNGKKLVINVWNKFAKELFDVSITIPGDPWLDNSIWNIYSEDNPKDQKYLVNLYNAYFKILIYRPLRNNQNTVSNLITGNYLCLKGCSHSISEGEYTTSLKLIKAW
jgi:hypothetical protein